MSIYTTQATIRKMPPPGQMKEAAPEHGTFIAPGALHSCVGGVTRSPVKFRPESIVGQRVTEPEPDPLKKGRG